ncbi:uncharacterized protein LOC115625565 [Scaptodrosophila lebanonensis]|uniref:Uncharacterized protein LOC115625565 n=1 Tax=Drosophila lebanonensis TaxID=7225 RepID=A0A6J2TLY2_DROLE|nr:uncharacterized protein LOC115625565 [Scaptodrosophila lebanonensis]
MVRHKQNRSKVIARAGHVKKQSARPPPPSLSPPLTQSPPSPQSPTFHADLALRQRLQFNQRINQRVTLCLELYHKNIIKKISRSLCELNKIDVYKLTKNICMTCIT